MRVKSLLPLVAGAAGLVALAALAATVPAVQTWAARKLIASRHGEGVSLAQCSLGFGRASALGLRVERGGAVMIAPRVDARMGLFSAWTGSSYRFDSLVAKDWTLDLTRAGPPAVAPPVAGSPAEAGAPWVARAVGGVLSAFEVPSNLSLDGVDLEGDVIFPDENGKPAGTLHVVITGGGLAAGSQGRFLCRVKARLDDPSAPVSSVSANATLTATLEVTGAFSRAELKADAVASGKGFPNGVGLSVDVSTVHGAGKKAYLVSLLRGSDQIAVVAAENPDGSTKVSGSWQVDLRDTDLAPFTLGRSLPVFHVAGSGVIDADGASGDLHATGKLQASADRLGALSRSLEPLGQVGLTADFDVARMGPSLRVARLDMGLSGATPVASVRALQSFEFNSASGELKVAVPTGDLVGISVFGIPLSWFGRPIPGIAVKGGDAHGEFVIRAEDGRLALRTRSPLTASGVAFSREGGQLASGLELSAFILGDYAPQGWQVQLAPLAVRTDGVKVLSVETRFGRLTGSGGAIKAAGSWSASLPKLLSLPGTLGIQRLSAGEASGSFEAVLDATSELEMKIAVRDLALEPGSSVALPSLDSEVHAEFAPEGRTTFSIPLHLGYSGRTADLSFAGSLTADPKGPRLDATIDGSQLTEEDLAGLSRLTGGGGNAIGFGMGPPSAQGHLWPPLRGKFVLRLMEVSLPKVDFRDVRAVLHVEPSSMRVEGASATLAGGGGVKLDGTLAYVAGAKPLLLTADVSVDGVESAPLFRSISPGKPTAIDGRFDVEAHLSAQGERLGGLLDGLRGDLKMNSKDGKFRALRADIIDSIKQAPSKLVDALDTVSSLFGKKTDKIGQALVESAKGLSEIHYDQMNILAERDGGGDITIKAINMISPEVRITGTGVISYAPGVSIRDQALSVSLNLGVQGKVGKVLDIVGLLSEGQDELGYSKMSQPIHLGGSLRSIDAGQWKDMLVQASLRKSGGLFDKLLGK